MKRKLALGGLALALAVSIGVAVGPQRALRPADPPVRPSGSAVAVVHAQPFVLDEGYRHTWRAEAPLVRAGHILVLEADPALLVRRQGPEPVLYAGLQTAERVNDGARSGRLVALVPAAPDRNGGVTMDLAATPIWFGPRGLPERVDASVLERELASALAQGVRPTGAAVAEAALTRGGGVAYLPDRSALDLLLADLVELHAPEETDLVHGLRIH